MREYNYRERVVDFFKGAYGILSIRYRMNRFEKMQKSGELEGMCASELHRKFMIFREG